MAPRALIDHCVHYKGYFLIGSSMGLALVVSLNRFPSARVSSISTALIFLLLCCPFGLRTAQGRAWWFAYLTLVIGTMGSVYWGLASAVGVLFAGASMLASGGCVCLRWNKPTDY